MCSHRLEQNRLLAARGTPGWFNAGFGDYIGDDETPADGLVRCWGDGQNGRLGNLSTETLGDDESLLASSAVDLGGERAPQVCAGGFASFALTESGSVYAWGAGGANLGLGHTRDIGDDELPQKIELGTRAESIACGGATCVVLQGGSGVRCWGANINGVLGTGSSDDVLGDDPNEVPGNLSNVNLGF